MKTRYDEAIAFVSGPLRQPLENISFDAKEAVQEVRLRGGRPVILVLGDRYCFVDEQGELLDAVNGQELICSFECLNQTFRAVCGYSVHTHQQEMVKGYITLKGGHRAGLGACAVERDGTISAVKEISSINIRVARQVFGVADGLIATAEKGGLLLAGRPGSGKTTVLRDLARQLAGGGRFPGKKVALLDERGELAAMWDGAPQNDVGLNTDVLHGFSKTAAMEMAVRSLSPDVIVCDEIGTHKEAEGMLSCMNAGVQVIASVHAGDAEELKKKQWIIELLKAGVFPFIAFLDGNKGKSAVERICRTDEWLAEIGGDSYCDDGFESAGLSNYRPL